MWLSCERGGEVFKWKAIGSFQNFWTSNICSWRNVFILTSLYGIYNLQAIFVEKSISEKTHEKPFSGKFAPLSSSHSSQYFDIYENRII